MSNFDKIASFRSNKIVIYKRPPVRQIGTKFNYMQPLGEFTDDFNDFDFTLNADSTTLSTLPNLSSSLFGKNKVDNSYNGQMSANTRRIFTGYIDKFYLVNQSLINLLNYLKIKHTFQITFVTLTLCSSQKHTDNELKRHLLGHFITIITRKYPYLDYIWRAEKQKNGNIHFHLLINQRINWESIREVWNRLLDKMGYLLEYTNKMSKMTLDEYVYLRGGYKSKNIDKIKEAYRSGIKSGWKNPNSTDIHSLLKVNDIQKYLSKYMAKNEVVKDNRGSLSDRLKNNMYVSGRIWGCSDNLRKYNYFDVSLINLGSSFKNLQSDIDMCLDLTPQNSVKYVYVSPYIHSYTLSKQIISSTYSSSLHDSMHFLFYYAEQIIDRFIDSVRVSLRRFIHNRQIYQHDTSIDNFSIAC